MFTVTACVRVSSKPRAHSTRDPAMLQASPSPPLALSLVERIVSFVKQFLVFVSMFLNTLL